MPKTQHRSDGEELKEKVMIPKLSINWIVVLKTDKRPELNNAHLKVLHEVSIEIEEGVMKIYI